MNQRPPSCPLCGRDMAPASGLGLPGRVSYWTCQDRTCPGLLSELEARPAREDLLGAPAQDLMMPAVTPAPGRGSGGPRRRARPTRGSVRAGFRERRYLDQGAFLCGFGGAERQAEDRKPLGVRLPLPVAAWLEQAAARADLSQNGLVVALLEAASAAPWCPTCNLPDLAGAAPLCPCEGAPGGEGGPYE